MRMRNISNKVLIRFQSSFLIQGSQVNTPIQNGRSPLHIAVQAQKLDMMKYLVAKGADVNVSCLLEFIYEASKIRS